MNTKKLAITALFISLAAIGGMFKMPLGLTSIAFDSLPALVAVLFLSAPFVGLIAAFGHFASALLSGFPLGPFHILIAAEMWIILWAFAKLHARGHHLMKWVVFILGNGVLAAVPFYFLLSPPFFYAAVPSLLIAAVLNAAAAAIALPFMARIGKKVE
jgi:hypothetical protein